MRLKGSVKFTQLGNANGALPILAHGPSGIPSALPGSVVNDSDRAVLRSMKDNQVIRRMPNCDPTALGQFYLHQSPIRRNSIVASVRGWRKC